MNNIGRKQNNYAFIDSQNLFLSLKRLGWKLDYRRFRVYLKEKYGVEKAFMFLGFLPDNKALYDSLKDFGFKLVFKPVVYDRGKAKGNCDAELVLQAAAIDFANYDKALIITGDGDFYCLVKFLKERGKLLRVLIPDASAYSALLKKFAGSDLAFMNDLRNKLEYKKKSTPEGRNLKGVFS